MPAVAEPMDAVRPSYSLTALFGSAVPLIVTPPSELFERFVNSISAVGTPVGGAVMFTLAEAEAELMFPATSTAMTVKLCAPTARSPVSKLQFPPPFAVAVPISVEPSNTLIVLFASVVPFRTRSSRVVVLPTASLRPNRRPSSAWRAHACRLLQQGQWTRWRGPRNW